MKNMSRFIKNSSKQRSCGSGICILFLILCIVAHSKHVLWFAHSEHVLCSNTRNLFVDGCDGCNHVRCASLPRLRATIQGSGNMFSLSGNMFSLSGNMFQSFQKHVRCIINNIYIYIYMAVSILQELTYEKYEYIKYG